MKKIEKVFKWILLKLLLILIPARKKTISKNIDEHSKILFIRLNKIGDALVTTPLLQEVKSNINCKIYVLADRNNHFIFSAIPSVNQIIVFTKGLKGILKILKFIRDEKIDVLVDLHDDISATVSFIVALSRVSNKFALSKGNDKLYSRTVEKLDASQSHAIDRIMKLSELFNFTPSREINVNYFPSEISLQRSRKFLIEKGLKDRFLAGINISAGSPARFWGENNFVRLLNFLSNYDIDIILLTSKDDQELAEKINVKSFPIFSSPVFDEFAAMISQLNLLFTPDTAAVHIASAYKIPTFGLYVKYKTNNMIWYSYASDFEKVITTEPTLKNVSFEQVIEKFKPFLENYL